MRRNNKNIFSLQNLAQYLIHAINKSILIYRNCKAWVLKRRHRIKKDVLKVVMVLAVLVLVWINFSDVEFKADSNTVEYQKPDFINMTKQLVQKTEERKYTKYIVIHHTASEKPSNQTNEEYIKEIEKMHRVDRGWSTIAYHIIIIGDKVYQCHPLHKKIAGVFHNNSSTINICVVGDFSKREPTETELNTIKNTIGWIKTNAYKMPEIVYHSDLNSTECCGAYLKEKLKDIRTWKTSY